MIGIIGARQAGYEHIWSIWLTWRPRGTGVPDPVVRPTLAACYHERLSSPTAGPEQCQWPSQCLQWPPPACKYSPWILTDLIDNRPIGGHYTAMWSPREVAFLYCIKQLLSRRYQKSHQRLPQGGAEAKRPRHNSIRWSLIIHISYFITADMQMPDNVCPQDAQPSGFRWNRRSNGASNRDKREIT